MKLIVLLTLLLFSTFSFADTSNTEPELARFDINCIGSSDTGQNTVDVNIRGSLSVFSPDQTGQLKLGSIGVFEFIADFKFHLNQKNYGSVTFSFQNADGITLSKSTHVLPKIGIVETSVYYFDTALGAAANVKCSISPTAVAAQLPSKN